MVRAFALGSFVIASLVAASTPADDKVQEIRQQIANLQAQLENLERQPTPTSRNVTQIGASRFRGKTTGGLVVRIYELNDLFAVAPPYSAVVASDLKPGAVPVFDTADGFASAKQTGGLGGFGGGGLGGQYNIRTTAAATSAVASAAAGQFGTASSVQSSQDDLIRVIKETISPELWADGGKISRLGNAFIISADDDTHQQIDALLNLFRTRWGTLRTISVRAWWVPLTPAELKGLLDVPTEKADADGPPVFGIVGDAAWQKILQAWEKPAGENARRHAYQATLTAYNGQTVSTLSGTQSLAVGNIQPVTTDPESGDRRSQLGYQPEVNVVQEGLAFQVTPISNMSGRTVLLDVHSRLSLPSGEGKREPAAERGDAAAVLPTDLTRAVDRRKVLVHRLSTTARVPVDRPYLVGGMSLASAETEGQQLYLFVKATVQELRNDNEEAGKAVKPADDAGNVDRAQDPPAAAKPADDSGNVEKGQDRPRDRAEEFRPAKKPARNDDDN